MTIMKKKNRNNDKMRLVELLKIVLFYYCKTISKLNFYFWSG